MSAWTGVPTERAVLEASAVVGNRFLLLSSRAAQVATYDSAAIARPSSLPIIPRGQHVGAPVDVATGNGHAEMLVRRAARTDALVRGRLERPHPN